MTRNDGPPMNPPSSPPEADLCSDLLDDLGDLRSQLMDLESLVHAAENVMKHMPDLPRTPGGPLDAATLTALRLHVGRLRSLVVMASRYAGSALVQADMLHNRAREIVRPDDGSDGSSRSNETKALQEYAPLWTWMPVPAAQISTKTRKRLAKEHPVLARHLGIEPEATEPSGNAPQPSDAPQLPTSIS